MENFLPNYQHLIDACNNIETARTPLYEHIIAPEVMEKILNREFAGLINGDDTDKKEHFSHYCRFFYEMGYDTVSYECCIGPAMPGSGALGGHQPGVIKNRRDFESYPWEQIPGFFFEKYAKNFEIMGTCLPKGMKAVGGPGNGVFELVQDVVGYEQLCLISLDDPELYKDLFCTVGTMMRHIWTEFLRRFSDLYAVSRFGDDLGFKASTLLSPDDIRTHIIPQYKSIVSVIHSYGKPFLYHSCGKIFPVMDDIIAIAHIDAKHSNEDSIAPFSEWVDRYGDRIGNFGGVDMDHLCSKTEQEITRLVNDVMRCCSKGKGGFAIGSGNSIPDYVPPEGYLAMVNAARSFRGE
jgi:uroporphyrinogen decarboxylase